MQSAPIENRHVRCVYYAGNAILGSARAPSIHRRWLECARNAIEVDRDASHSNFLIIPLYWANCTNICVPCPSSSRMLNIPALNSKIIQSSLRLCALLHISRCLHFESLIQSIVPDSIGIVFLYFNHSLISLKRKNLHKCSLMHVKCAVKHYIFNWRNYHMSVY